MDFNFSDILEHFTHNRTNNQKHINKHLDIFVDRSKASKTKENHTEDVIDFYSKNIKSALNLINNIEGDEDLTEIRRGYYEQVIDVLNERLETILHDTDYYIYLDPFKLGNHSNKFSYYPALLDNQYTTKLLSKKEFLYNRGNTPKKTLRNVFKGFKKSPVQRLVKNYISTDTPYNGILLWHEVGVGKTCAAIGIAENFKNRIFTKSDRTIILTPGQTLKESWFDEIFNIKKEITHSNTNYNKQCTGETYNFIMNKESANYNRIKRRRDKIIQKYYYVDGYRAFSGKFYRELEEYLNSVERKNKKFYNRNLIKYIKEKFSNRVVILDEIHVTRETKKVNTIDGKKIRKCLELIVRYSENLKLILLSATPMYDDASEIIWLINLLRLNDNRSPLNINYFFKNDRLIESKKEEFASKIKGYISYQRGEDPFIFPTKLWPSVNNSDKLNLFIPDNINNIIRSDFIKLEKDAEIFDLTESEIRIKLNEKLDTEPELKQILGNNQNLISKKFNDNIKHLSFYRSFMDNWQYNLYRKYLEETPNIDDFNMTLRQFSNIILPKINTDNTLNHSIGMPVNNFNKLFIKKRGKYTIHNSLIDDANKSILHVSRLGKYSQKIKNIIKIIDESTGIIFIYSKFIDYGALITALSLEENGYSRFNIDSHNKINRGDNLLVNGTYKKKPKGSYILLTGQVGLTGSKKILNKLKDVCNSVKNRNGDIIKIIIGSGVVEQGISFFNIRQTHMLDPWYNINSYNQVIGRGVRRLSHKNLPEKERNVTIYIHLSVKPNILIGGGKKKIKNIKKKLDNTETLIDEKLYSIGLRKHKEILMIQKILKKESFDCNLNKKSNIFIGKSFNKIIKLVDARNNERYITNQDWSNSIACDFGKCDYKCSPDINIDTLETNTDTYNLNLIKEDMMICKQIIKSFFEKNVGISFDQLKIRIAPLLQDQKKTSKNIDNIILLSLGNIIKNKEQIYNKTLGDHVYLKEVSNIDNSNNYYVIQRDDKETLDKLKYLYLPNNIIKHNVPITSIPLIKNISDNKNFDNISPILLGNLIKLLQVSICNSFITYFEDAEVIINSQQIFDMSKIYDQLSSINRGGVYLNHTLPVKKNGSVIRPKKYNKFGYNVIAFESDTHTDFRSIMKDRRNKFFGKKTDKKFIGEILKVKNARVSRIHGGVKKIGTIITPRNKLNMTSDSSTKTDFMEIKYIDNTIEKIVFNGHYTSGETYINIEQEKPVTNRFFDGTKNDLLPNIYDIIYNYFLTEIEKRSVNEKNGILKNIFKIAEGSVIGDYIDPFFFYKTNKIDHTLQTPYRIDFLKIDDEDYLKSLIIRIIFYNYFSSRNLSVKYPNNSKILTETHNFNKFSYFLTDKMYNGILGNSHSGDEVIKYLVIPTSSVPKNPGPGRIGKDSYDIFEKNATGEIVKITLLNKVKIHFNKHFFPNPDEGSMVGSNIYSFISTNSDSIKNNSFYVVNKDKGNYTEVKTRGTGKISKKVDRTGAPCGNAKGVKKNNEIGKFINNIITKFDINNTGLKRFGDLGKRWPLVPSKDDLCMELKFLIRHLDQLGYEDHSKTTRVSLNTKNRYFYREHIKIKIERS